MSEEQKKAMDKALRFLSVRGHSVSELRAKLLKRDFCLGAVEYAVAECERLGFLNDRIFAEQYLDELRNRGYGDRKCRVYMFKKGLSDDLVNSVIEDTLDAGSDFARAEAVMQRKLKSLAREADPRKRREKATRFMVGRGFSFDIISEVYEKLVNSE